MARKNASLEAGLNQARGLLYPLLRFVKIPFNTISTTSIHPYKMMSNRLKSIWGKAVYKQKVTPSTSPGRLLEPLF